MHSIITLQNDWASIIHCSSYYLAIWSYFITIIPIFPYEISSYQIQSHIAILQYTPAQCTICHWSMLFDLFHPYEVHLKVCTYVCYFVSISTIQFCKYWCQFKATELCLCFTSALQHLATYVTSDITHTIHVQILSNYTLM